MQIINYLITALYWITYSIFFCFVGVLILIRSYKRSATKIMALSTKSKHPESYSLLWIMILVLFNVLMAVINFFSWYYFISFISK